MNNNVKSDSDEPVQRDRTRTFREKLLTLCRQFTVYFLSTGGLSIALVAYSILGGFIFMYIESPKEVRTRNEMKEMTKSHAKQLWEVTEAMNILHPENWTEVAEGILEKFSQEVFRATKKNGWDGSNEENELQWSYAGSMLYSITVITTIGYGHIAPKTAEGKVVTIIYAVFGIPLTMLTLTNIGSFMAILFRFLYKNLVCGILCGRCRRCRKPALRHNDVGAIQNDVNTSHDYVIAVETRADVEECYEYSCAVDAGSEKRECSTETGCAKTVLEFCEQEGAIEGDRRIGRIENGSCEWRISGKESMEKRLPDGGPEVEKPGHVDTCFEDQDHLRRPEFLQERLRRSQDELVLHIKTQRGLAETEMEKNPQQENGVNLFHIRNKAYPESSSIASETEEPEEEVLGFSESSRMMVEAKLVGDPEKLTRASVRSVTVDQEVGTRPLTVVKHRLMKWRRGFQIHLYADDNKRVKVPIYVSVLVMSVYVFAGSLLFTLWEKDWDYLVGSYFCFITLSTIGFGDYVPGTSIDDWASQDKLVLCALYLVFGLALIAMCFDLMQEEVRARCKAFARNIGLIKEEID